MSSVEPKETALAPRSRKGALDAGEVTAWMERTEGLAAPRAPAEGALAANRTGWLVGLGGLRRRFFPRVGLVVERMAPVLTGYAFARMVIGLLGLDPHWVTLVASMIGMVTIPMGTLELVARRRMGRARRRALSVDSPDGVAPGTYVHLRGTVVAQPTARTLARGTAAVIFRNRVWWGADETRAIDFWVELADGQRVKVSARQAILLDAPRPVREPAACGPVFLGSDPDGGGFPPVFRLCPEPITGAPWWRLVYTRLRESSLGPGDPIELWGALEQELNPEAERGGSRNPPLATVICSRPGHPLFLRTPGR